MTTNTVRLRKQPEQSRVHRNAPSALLRLFRASTIPAFLTGSAFHTGAYDSIAPSLAMLVTAIPAWLFLGAFRRSKFATQPTFAWLIAFYWMIAGLVVLTEGPTRISFDTSVDAEKFYTFLLSGRATEPLEELRLHIEGAFAVKAWSYLHGLFSSVGVAPQPYMGIIVNVLLMSLSGVLCLALLQSVSKITPERAASVCLYFSLSGLFLLFATLHVRDAFSCFAVTATALPWTLYLRSRSASALMMTTVTLPVASYVLYYVREEFAFLPLTFAAAALGALFVAGNIRGAERQRVNLLILLGLLGLATATQIFGSELLEKFQRGTTAYAGFAATGADRGSLGMAVFVNQPLYIKLLIGPFYVTFMPLPIWFGFLSGESYQLFKSIGALFHYILAPAVAAAAIVAFTERTHRTAPLVFLLAVVVIMTVAVGATSAEGRHLGAFLPLAIAAVHSLHGVASYTQYNRTLRSMIILFMALAHGLWIAFKLL